MQDVEPSPGSHDIGDELVDKRRQGDVTGVLLGATALGTHLSDRFLRPLGHKIIYHHMSAVGGEQASGRPSDT